MNIYQIHLLNKSSGISQLISPERVRFEDKMKIMILMKLSDRVLKNHISPMVLSNDIDKIIIIRDEVGPKMNKVRYYCPPKWSLNFPIVAMISRLLLSIYLSLKERSLLIHSYLLFPHGLLAFAAAKLTNKKVGVSLIAGPVELFIFGNSPTERYAYTKPLPKLSFIGKILLMVLNDFDIISVTGTFSKKFLINHGVMEGKIFILPHIVDCRFIKMNITKQYDVISIGRLEKVKHIEVLIRSISIVKNNFSSIKVAIVGDGPEKRQLEELVIDLGLEDNVLFLGYQSDVWNWFNKAKISVLTSEREGFPYSVIESLCCGVPVVATDCGDLHDILISGYNGDLIKDYNDAKSFADMIIRLLQNDDLINMYSNNALEISRKIRATYVTEIWENMIHKLN